MLHRNEFGSFGISYDNNNFIIGIHQGGPAAKNGEIRIGDKVHSINNVPLTPYNNMDHMLHYSGTPVRIKVQRNNLISDHNIMRSSSKY